MPADRNTLKRKPRAPTGPYKPRAPSKPKNAPKTSAKPITSKKRDNLTLHDWMIVFSYIDSHPGIPQEKVVQYFRMRQEGALEFTQSTLSRKLKDRQTLQKHIDDNPNALSSKRARIVTRPDVDRSLYLWLKHMEEKGEIVNGPMLVAKCARFEAALDVPEAERLTGDGWLKSFTKAYNIKEFRRHGEAGSVDLASVAAERVRVSAILAKFEPKDRFNFDEKSFFAFAPPDRGLATKQMSGKKSDKFRITLGLACNADGSEKLPLIFIRKSAKPRCFKGKTPQAWGFDYSNNKKAWMTGELFTKWLKNLDFKMRQQERKIILLLDNFSGHYVDYIPKNIQVEFFAPNLTSFVQPCDGGIIRCFKANYRRAFFNLLEAMLMAKDAWNAVTQDTIRHCWDHTKIQQDLASYTPPVPSESLTAPALPKSPLTDPKAWEIIEEFATSDMSLPQAEERLKVHLGSRYVEAEWRDAFKAVMDAEKDTLKALESIKRLTNKVIKPSQPSNIGAVIPNTVWLPLPAQAPPRHLVDLEKSLEESVIELKKRNRIIGTPLTLEEMLNPAEERVIGDACYRFEGGDSEIIAQVKHEMAVQRGDIIEIDSDGEEEEEEEDNEAESIMDVISMCESMERLCLRHGKPETSLELSRALRQFRIHLRKTEMAQLRQKTLYDFFGKTRSA
ncbi:hypothetical protein M422DRAFT_257083 [Sphaerobolus stellatus SS14]|uniref:HTH CENPB-type domain-containing protein n=1 Tax=Sphaerobolus stellatus (strain SS14) TaxID=990650 RepID=A0A0C9UA64_SPHS4|nr:hypothetical protein M422DRAFT_257083 [Sphaerobolus stellatus SS14]